MLEDLQNTILSHALDWGRNGDTTIELGEVPMGFEISEIFVNSVKGGRRFLAAGSPLPFISRWSEPLKTQWRGLLLDSLSVWIFLLVLRWVCSNLQIYKAVNKRL